MYCKNLCWVECFCEYIHCSKLATEHSISISSLRRAKKTFVIALYQKEAMIMSFSYTNYINKYYHVQLLELKINRDHN